jgi:hypothetical protein
MSSYRDAKREMGDAVPQDTNPELEPMSCRSCGGMSTRGQLAAYGARCFRCYESYCSAYISRPSVMGNGTGNRAWAHALKAREESGEQLTKAAREAWRAAIGHTAEANS